MEADLINAYIEELNNEVAALMKAKIALAARLRVAEQERDAAKARIEELEKKKPSKGSAE